MRRPAYAALLALLLLVSSFLARLGSVLCTGSTGYAGTIVCCRENNRQGPLVQSTACFDIVVSISRHERDLGEYCALAGPARVRKLSV